MAKLQTICPQCQNKMYTDDYTIAKFYQGQPDKVMAHCQKCQIAFATDCFALPSLRYKCFAKGRGAKEYTEINTVIDGEVVHIYNMPMDEWMKSWRQYQDVRSLENLSSATRTQSVIPFIERGSIMKIHGRWVANALLYFASAREVFSVYRSEIKQSDGESD